jgi:protein-disulfide isomerase
MAKRAIVATGRVTSALLAAVLIAVFAIYSCGQTGAADAQSTGSDWEGKIRSFLQKRFKIPQGSNITFGPPQPSAFPGLYSRTVTLTNEQGASAKFTLFTDGKSSKLIVGEVLDMQDDPWARVDMGGLRLEDRAVMGPASAPVTIVEFADFECPFCARAFGVLEAAAQNRYHGQIRLIFKNFPLRGHSWARGAAIAAECVRLQNPEAFWTFANDIYAAQPQIRDSNLRDYVEQFSGQLNLDKTALNACMMSPAPEKTINQDIKDGNAVHVNSTPTFFVNGVPLVGVPDEKTLDFVIGAELHPKTSKAQ